MKTTQYLNREDEAREQIGQTNVSPTISVLLASLFMASILVVPVLQLFDEYAKLKPDSRSIHLPACFSILKSLPESWNGFRASNNTLSAHVVTANQHVLRDMRHYENTLEESAWLTRALLPWAQWGLTHGLGVGNEKVYLGDNGWLFYRPDVKYLTGPGFLSARHITSRLKSRDEWTPIPHPDPVKAITDFAAQLNAKGIHLVVMPTPVKPMIHPEKLSPAFHPRGTIVQNASFSLFMERLREKGVVTFDCSDLLTREFQKTGQPQYLVGDTHWRPEAMGRVASSLADTIWKSGRLSLTATVQYKQVPVNLSSVGDIRALLKFPRSLGPADLETVQIQQILSQDGELWTADRDAEVLLLGDSFSTIFSMSSMGWGSAAGFAEQLSFYLQKPVDRIAQNDNGSFATREALLRETTDGAGRLKGKRVIIWQFAIRELSQGDWKVFHIP
jgi:alginate O-acetyltransferase complex protein AlgJ